MPAIPTNSLMFYENGQLKRLPAGNDVEITGAFTASGFTGSGANLTSLPAGQLTGALPALDGSLLTSLNASNISSGTLGDSYLSANVPLLNAGTNTFTGAISATSFSGSGASITSIAAGNITTGELADARLSVNVALYDAATPTFANTVTAAAFSGSGASLTSLDAGNVSTGTLDDGRLSANVLLKNAASNTLTGSLTVDGDLNVTGDIISGGSVNVVLQDQFLDLNGNNLTGTAQAGGIAVNVLNTGSAFDVVSFTPGSSGVDPVVVVSGDASALSAGDLIQVSQSTAANDGQYIVYSRTYSGGPNQTTITVRGNAASAHPAADLPQLPFVHNQFATEGAGAKVTAITVGVIAVSNGGLYQTGHVAVDPGDWCYAYGASASQFTDNWISLRPSSTPSLQTAYNASNSPATIEMTAAKSGLTIKPATGETVALDLQASAESQLKVTGAALKLDSSHTKFLTGPVSFAKAGTVPVASTSALDEGTLVYLDSSGNAAAADAESATLLYREVDGAVGSIADFLASVGGSKVVAKYNGSAPAVGSVVYLGGGANAGTCQTAVPTTGRVTKLGKVVVAGSAGVCTILWSPDYIADL